MSDEIDYDPNNYSFEDIMDLFRIEIPTSRKDITSAQQLLKNRKNEDELKSTKISGIHK